MVVVRYRMRRSKEDALPLAQDSGTFGWYGDSGVKEKTNIVKKTEKRSRNGCLTCRARRKKCDETKPKCIGCQRNLLLCRWSDKEGGSTETSPNGDEVGIKANDGFLNCTLESWEGEYDVGDYYKFISIPSGQVKFEYTVALDKTGCIWRIHSDNGRQRLQKFPTYGQLGKSSITTFSHPLKIVKVQSGPRRVKTIKPFASSTSSTAPVSASDVFSIDSNETTFQKDGGLFDIKPLFDLQLEPYHFERDLQSFGSFLYSSTPFSTVHSNYSYLLYDSNASATYYKQALENSKHGDLSQLKNLKDEDAFLFYVCLKEYIPLLGPQDTSHPMLTTSSTFVPQVENNPVMKELFLCCAASYLEYYSEELFAPLSEQLYENSVLLLSNFLRNHSVTGNEVWLLATFQLMCLRNKLPLRKTVDDCVRCLAKSYVIIRNCYSMQNSGNVVEQLNATSQYSVFNSQFNESANNSRTWEMLHMELEDNTSEIPVLRQDSMVLLPQERTFLESFIYNYSVAIMFATDISQLPSPFRVFKELNLLLKCPIYECPSDWVKSPVLGSTLEAFEILAKVSYISRFPMPVTTSTILEKCRELELMAKYYSNSVIELQSAELLTYQNATLSFLCGLVVARTSYLLVITIIEYETLHVYSPKVQKVVREIMAYLEGIPLDNNIWAILPWPLMVCGFFCCEPDDQSRIRFYLNLLGKLFNLGKGQSMSAHLDKVWRLPMDKWLEQLFNRTELCKVCI
ncbi:Zn(II)2Cys6 transcription factor Ecym_2672 [Eremothecium cymbalariae DBVPG|uniref:Zn(2)-C6 fungal-type domain-containing protein n=1 Tax=Eremothecium cymbalariae (strain CBS 270.75 / DBVPG 7215 / KCTC 17166 / NRRL Y-17582) TaxID=931890 RepID=G8JNV7_ERECY|nr:Hypothetical protein Ecym_2672 [Eremothecium cymbalariae DBVPG\